MKKIILVILLYTQSTLYSESVISEQINFIKSTICSLNEFDSLIKESTFYPYNNDYILTFDYLDKKFKQIDSNKILFHNYAPGINRISIFDDIEKQLLKYQGYKYFKNEKAGNFLIDIPYKVYEFSIKIENKIYNFEFRFEFRFDRWEFRKLRLQNENFTHYECNKISKDIKNVKRKGLPVDTMYNIKDLIEIFERNLISKSGVNNLKLKFISDNELIKLFKKKITQNPLKMFRYVYFGNCEGDDDNLYFSFTRERKDSDYYFTTLKFKIVNRNYILHEIMDGIPYFMYSGDFLFYNTFREIKR